MIKLGFYKILYELGWWWHLQGLKVTQHLSDDWCDRMYWLFNSKLYYWALNRGSKLKGWRP